MLHKKTFVANNVRAGFTLFEVTVVFLIVALLIAGIIIGSSLISSAKSQAFIKQVAEYDVGIQRFESKYRSVPGDSPFLEPPGDGDEKIESEDTPDMGASFTGEVANFWVQLDSVKGVGARKGYVAEVDGTIKVAGSSSGAPNVAAASIQSTPGTGIIATYDNGSFDEEVSKGNLFIVGKMNNNDGTDISFNNIEDAKEVLFNGSVKMVIFTKGKDGAEIYTKDKVVSIEGNVVEVVDTTGAGDSFIGAFLFKLLENEVDLEGIDKLSCDTIRDYLLFANHYAAYSTTKKGAIASYANLEEIQEYIKNR